MGWQTDKGIHQWRVEHLNVKRFTLMAAGLENIPLDAILYSEPTSTYTKKEEKNVTYT